MSYVPSPRSARRRGNDSERSVTPVDVPEDVTLEMLRAYEAELKTQQARVTVARVRAAPAVEIDRRRKTNELRHELKSLEARVIKAADDRRSLEDELERLRSRKDAAEDEQRRMDARVKNFDIDVQIEKIALQRMVLEKTQEERRRLEEDMREKQALVKAAQDIRANEDKEIAGLLKGVLGRAGHLEKEYARGTLREDRLADYARELEKTDPTNPPSRRVINEVIANREEKRKSDQERLERETRTLNEQRANILRRRQELEREKRGIDKLKSRGREYMAKVDLGEAGVSARSTQSDRGENMPPIWTDVTRTINSARAKLTQTEERIKNLRDELASKPRKRARTPYVYHGEFGITSVPLSQRPTFEWIRNVIVEDVLRRALSRARDPPMLRDLLRERDRVMVGHKELTQKVERELGREVERDTAAAITDDVIREVAAEVVAEMSVVERHAQDLSIGAISTVLARQVEHLGTRHMYKRTLQALAEAKIRARGPKKGHSQPLVPSGWTIDKGSADIIEGAPFDALDKKRAVVLSLEHHINGKKSSSSELRKYQAAEKAYWDNVKLENSPLVASEGNKKERPFVLSPSPDGRSLAALTSTGRLLIWDVVANPPVLLRAHPTAGQGAQVVRWSIDGMQLLVMTEAGTVRLLTVVSTAKPEDDGKRDDYQALPVTVLVELTREQFVISGIHHTGREKRCQPTYIAFHSSFTMMGGQPSFCVGLANGDIIKCNTLSSLYAVHVPVLIPLESQPEITPTTRAEVFRGHNSPVIFIGFVAGGATMVTCHDDDHIVLWPYTLEGQSGLGWFAPSHKLTFDWSVRDSGSDTVLQSMALSRSKRDLICIVQSRNANAVFIVIFDLEARRLRPPYYSIPDAQTALLAVSPVLDATSSDYAYVLASNTLHIVSLATGQAVQDPRPIVTPEHQVTGMALGAHDRLVMSCRSALLVFDVKPPAEYKEASKTVPLAQAARADTRRERSFAEQRVRDVVWTFAVGAHQTAQGSVRRLARELLDEMITKAVGEGRPPVGVGGASRRPSGTPPEMILARSPSSPMRNNGRSSPLLVSQRSSARSFAAEVLAAPSPPAPAAPADAQRRSSGTRAASFQAEAPDQGESPTEEPPEEPKRKEKKAKKEKDKNKKKDKKEKKKKKKKKKKEMDSDMDEDEEDECSDQ